MKQAAACFTDQTDLGSMIPWVDQVMNGLRLFCRHLVTYSNGSMTLPTSLPVQVDTVVGQDVFHHVNCFLIGLLPHFLGKIEFST